MKFVSLSFLYISAAFADPTKTIIGNALATPSLSSLVQVLSNQNYAPLLQSLNSPGGYTVFAPNNAALAAAGIDTNNVDLVTQVLRYHVLPAVVPSSNLTALQFPQTLLTDQRYALLGGRPQVLDVRKDSNGVTLNFGIPGVANQTARVRTADVISTNGVVHIIDRVLMFPDTASRTAQAAGLTELVAALQKAGLANIIDTTPSVTIFAPSNDALLAAGWSNLNVSALQSVLQYHVVPGVVAYSTNLSNMQIKTLGGNNVTVGVNGNNVQINDANVVLPNVLIRNGVVHVIDKVLMPMPPAPLPKGKAGKLGKNGKNAKGKNGKMMMMGQPQPQPQPGMMMGQPQPGMMMQQPGMMMGPGR